jgi:ADP-heptose:LPS heptosyltransferase
MKKRDPKILLIREGARGDVLLTTPVIRLLRKKYPNSSITFKTDYPEILDNNPYLDGITTKHDNREYDVTYNLRYELFPEKNYVEAYTKIVGVEEYKPQLEFYLRREEKEDVRLFLQSLPMEGDKLAILHPMTGDRTKSWGGEKYQHICDYFLTNNYNVITIGESKDCMELSGALNLIGKTSIRMAAALTSKADIFFGIDSFPMHLANAFKVPSVVLFGPTSPRKVVCNNDIVYAVQSNERCLTCRHKATPDKWAQNVSCHRDRLYCMENISSKQVIEAIESLIAEGKHNDKKHAPCIAR